MQEWSYKEAITLCLIFLFKYSHSDRKDIQFNKYFTFLLQQQSQEVDPLNLHVLSWSSKVLPIMKAMQAKNSELSSYINRHAV
jgi:hypothetical protein